MDIRELFGPSREQIWRQFAAAVGGNFGEGSLFTSSVVEAMHGQWVVTLDTNTTGGSHSSYTYTRMRAPYVNPDGFHFNVYRKGLFSDLGKRLGMQDVTVGHAQFDEDFIIQGNDEAKLRQLFDNAKIRDLIVAQPDIHFSVKDDDSGFWIGRRLPPQVSELCFQAEGVIKDLDQLRRLYDLFSETLDELCRIGSAYDKNTGVRLPRGLLG